MASIVTKAKLPNFSFDVDSVSGRALTKSVDGGISIGGQAGAHGYAGARGIHGISGYHGSCSIDGGHGTSGTNGCNGTSGHSGTNSQHALVWLNGTSENLNIQLKTFHTLNDFNKHSAIMDWNSIEQHGDINRNFQLANSKGIILVNAAGGNGGHGGAGGDGGNGGHGGRGGDGLDGTPGFSGIGKGASGGSGGNGRPGGNGGRGGDGGSAGSGGNGGNAGAGGHVQVRSVDPRLFMLVEVNSRPGLKGTGGSAGKGGQAGRGGSGGWGGRGGSGGSGGPGGCNGMSGISGIPGLSGRSGSAGSDGYAGIDGHAASYGSILYAVVGIDGNIYEEGPDKYHASVVCYTITDENNDGIYEPGTNFFITNVQWTNNGAMAMPSGAILSFPSTKYISSDNNDVSVLPNANINEVLLNSHQFKCHLHDMSALPFNKPYVQSVTIRSQINLLNRLFSGSVVSTTLTSQYPIQMTNIEIPTFLGPNERAIVTVHFTNISARSYGACPDSAGSVEFMVTTHSLIKIVCMNEKSLYQIMPDGHACYKINEQISPQSKKSIKFEILFDPESAKLYYESLFCHIDLLLRDKLIEKRQHDIRIIPTFRPDLHTDVLIITNSQVNRAEYLTYQKLLQLFNYSSQTWPMERYGTLNHPEIKWLNTTNLIILIYSNPQSTLKTIKSESFLQHMNSSEQAGFICIGACQSNQFDFALFDYNHLQYVNVEDRAESVSTKHIWTGIGLFRPTEEQYKAKANKLRKAYEKQKDHRFLYQVVYDNTIYNDFYFIFSIIYGQKYVYKSTLDSQVGNRLIVVTSDNPLLTTSHLPFNMQERIHTTEQNEAQVIIQNEIDLNSRFGRLLCAILSYQGFEKAYTIISEQRQLKNAIFQTISTKFYFSQILVSLAMSIIEREYDRGSIEFRSSERLVNEIGNVISKENNTRNNRGADPYDWLYLLIQALHEFIDSKFLISFPWCCKWTVKAKQRHKLQIILSDLSLLSTTNISKNKQIYSTVKLLRLQKLASLSLPAADVRINCVRSIKEIQAWKAEQKLNRIQS